MHIFVFNAKKIGPKKFLLLFLFSKGTAEARTCSELEVGLGLGLQWIKKKASQEV